MIHPDVYDNSLGRFGPSRSTRPYSRGMDSNGRSLTFPEGLPLVLVQPLDSDGLKSDPGGRVILKHLPHVLLAEAEQVRVAQRADGSGTPVARGPHVQPAQKSTYYNYRSIEYNRSS